jgi:hypothetical protein
LDNGREGGIRDEEKMRREEGRDADRDEGVNEERKGGRDQRRKEEREEEMKEGMNVYDSQSYSDLPCGMQYNTKTAENHQIIAPREHSSLLHSVKANGD